jgi:LPS sulfotransferase NodH
MGMRQMVRFVVFAAPRTGSNLLCSLLNAHPEVLCHHGLFNPQGIHCAREHPGCAARFGSVSDRDRDPKAFLDAVWALGGDTRAIGFKMNRGENDEAQNILLRDRSVRKFLLKRQNRVRTYVSEEIAKRTGVWESYEEPADSTIPAIRVEVQDLMRHLNLNAAYYAKIEAVLKETGQDWFETHYEALAESSEIARVLHALGVEARSPLPAASHKRSPSDLGLVVENVGELAVALQGTALFDDLHSRDAPDLHFHSFTR